MRTYSTSLVWFRTDLRLADNPALYHALEQSETVIPVFLWTPDEEGDWPPGAASRWYLHHSLRSLQQELEARGSTLIVRQGASCAALLEALIDETGASAVFWNKRYEPCWITSDAEAVRTLRAAGARVHTFESYLLHNPEAVRTQSGTPYRVYTPFWRRFSEGFEPSPPLAIPRMGASRSPASWPEHASIDTLNLLSEIDWAEGLRDTWTAGETAARNALETFIDEAFIDYDDHRNRPDLPGTSRLSPRLHFGELSPLQVWTAVTDWVQNAPMKAAARVFLQEMAWREFSYHVLYHHPSTPTDSLKARFNGFPWTTNKVHLEAWQQGQTGFPIVDAGMRQLWHIGWMHNRVRMIVASFLTKDLRIHWLEGARWFWDTLVDANLANNTMGWQWSAGSGADAQPFFRIFNPTSQGKKFDPNGYYVRTWVPELNALPDRYLHAPWTAPASVLEDAGITLGDTYPEPLVDHGEARDAALDAYNQIK